MILVTGGLGFIGSHTVRALLDAGEGCVLLQRRPADLPDDLAGSDVACEQADVADLDRLLAVGARHRISGIVHLAGSMPWPAGGDQPVQAAQRSLAGLFNILEAGRRWGVRRIGVASTIGVYGGVDVQGGLTEDLALTMTGSHLIPTFKKIGELLNGYLADAAELDIVNYRISGTWGPRGHDDPFFAAPELVHAAVEGRPVDLSKYAVQPHLEDSLDLCYVKDTGRAIAALQVADGLRHRTYNVASGHETSNADIVDALRTIIPDAQLDLPTGGTPRGTWLDITRLRQDTDFAPEYDLDRAAADYVAWLRAGNSV